MTLKKVDLIPEQVDALIVSELKLIVINEATEYPEYSLAARLLLRYFLTKAEYNAWLEEGNEESL
jgi:hypothetical protein